MSEVKLLYILDPDKNNSKLQNQEHDNAITMLVKQDLSPEQLQCQSSPSQKLCDPAK
jgi:hypothetical protein